MEKSKLTKLVFTTFGLLLLTGVIAVAASHPWETEINEFEGIPIFTVTSNASVPYFSNEEMMRKADLIVQGKISKIDEAKWSTLDGNQPRGVKTVESLNEHGDKVIDYYFEPESGESIYTDMTFEIEKFYKGEGPKEVIVRTLSGTVDEFHMNEASYINVEDFKEGDEYTLFLIEDDGPTTDFGPKHYIVLTARGKLSSSPVSTARGVISPSNGELVNPLGETMKLEELL